MEQIVQLIVEKTGLPAEQARQAALIAVNFLKEKLPPPIDGQIDAVLNGQYGDIAGQASGLLGGLLGGDKK
ncbi:MAG: hypothetical protein OHK0022_22290 [Roseiflexaceae bacterium]